MQQFKIKVSQEMNDMRLDLAVVSADIGLSRRRIRLSIDAGGVYINKKRARIASRKVRVGDQIAIEYDPELRRQLASNFALNDSDFIHIGPDFVILNKPAGLASQPTRSQSIMHVASEVSKYLKLKGEQRKPVLVHRLDRDTSGAMILALNERKASYLQEQFRDRLTQKIYHAICVGVPNKMQFSIQNHLSRPDGKGYVHTVHQDRGGRYAETDFETIDTFLSGKISLMSCIPVTGRTHQIRVHLLSRGLPILGDKKYGTQQHEAILQACGHLSCPHHMLHARQLTISTDRNKPARIFTAPYPESFAKVMRDLQ